MRAYLALMGLIVLTMPVNAQLGDAPPTPATVPLASGFYTVGAGGNLGHDGGFTNATGTAGANPGWTLFLYGNEDGGGRLRISAPSDAPGTLTYWTANPDAPNTSAAALNFSPGTSGQWRIIAPATNTSADLQVTVSNGSGTYLALNDTAQLEAYNQRLNEVFQFNASEWYDPNTNAPISSTVGTFEFTFADFSGGRYRSIDLVYSPVPEPVSVLALTSGFLGLGSWVRRRSGSPQNV